MIHAKIKIYIIHTLYCIIHFNFTNYTNYTGKCKNILKIDNILYNLICIITIHLHTCIIYKNITCINSQYCTALARRRHPYIESLPTL